MATLLDNGYKQSSRAPGWGFKMLDKSEKDSKHPVIEARRLDDMASFCMTWAEPDDEFLVDIRLKDDSFDDYASSQHLREFFVRLGKECRGLMGGKAPDVMTFVVAHQALVTDGASL